MSNSKAAAIELQKYAYAFPINTTANWSYDNLTSMLRTDFNVETEVKEGTNNKILMGFLPPHWATLAS